MDASELGRQLQALRKTHGGPPRRLVHSDTNKRCGCYDCRKAQGRIRTSPKKKAQE